MKVQLHHGRNNATPVLDDLDAIRSGGMKLVFGQGYAPATLGQLLREFTHGHALQPTMVTFDGVVLILTVLRKAAGISSSITFAKAGARSVMTTAGSPCAVREVVKNLRAEAVSRHRDTNTSMTCPCWSTARYT